MTIEGMGREIVRWGLDIVLAWIGAMKFTAHEAMGIQPLVAHSPFISCMYDFLSVRSFSAMLGCIEIGTAALLGLRSQSLDPVHQQPTAYLLDVSSTWHPGRRLVPGSLAMAGSLSEVVSSTAGNQPGFAKTA